MSNVFVLRCPNCQHGIEISARSVRTPAVQKSVLDKKSNGKKPATEQKEYVDVADLGELLDMINDSQLAGWEADFIGQTRERYNKYGNDVRMTKKQMNKVRSIAGEPEEDF